MGPSRPHPFETIDGLEKTYRLERNVVGKLRDVANVFLSYVEQDSTVADQIVVGLRLGGIAVAAHIPRAAARRKGGLEGIHVSEVRDRPVVRTLCPGQVGASRGRLRSNP